MLVFSPSCCWVYRVCEREDFTKVQEGSQNTANWLNNTEIFVVRKNSANGSTAQKEVCARIKDNKAPGLGGILSASSAIVIFVHLAREASWRELFGTRRYYSRCSPIPHIEARAMEHNV